MDTRNSKAFNVSKTRDKVRKFMKIHTLPKIHQYFISFNKKKMKEND